MASLNWRRIPAEIVNFIDIFYHPVEWRCPTKSRAFGGRTGQPSIAQKLASGSGYSHRFKILHFFWTVRMISQSRNRGETATLHCLKIRFGRCETGLTGI
jgi:hypothetical protein